MRTQRDIFLSGGGDAYERRNPDATGLDPALLNRVARHLHSGDRVLEIGCGSGANLRALDELVSGEIQCFGCDPSALAVAHARERAPRHQYPAATSDEPSSDETFDLVLFSFVLHWDYQALGREVERRLRLRRAPQATREPATSSTPGEPRWWVSHETIYQVLDLQGRDGLKAELTDALSIGRARHRLKKSNPGRGARGSLKDIVSISEPPAEVAYRASAGHWEEYLVLGRRGKSQVVPIVERTTRFTLLVALPTDRKAHTVREAVASKIDEPPEHLRRTLTWDQGKEMTAHVRFHAATDVTVYFCDPHSPWQRGTNANTKGLLGQYPPRCTDLTTVTANQLDYVAAEMNERPRETLGWKTPVEKFNDPLQ